MQRRRTKRVIRGAAPVEEGLPSAGAAGALMSQGMCLHGFERTGLGAAACAAVVRRADVVACREWLRERGGALLVKNGSSAAQRADAGVDARLPERRLARRGPKPGGDDREK